MTWHRQLFHFLLIWIQKKKCFWPISTLCHISEWNKTIMSIENSFFVSMSILASTRWFIFYSNILSLVRSTDIEGLHARPCICDACVRTEHRKRPIMSQKLLSKISRMTNDFCCSLSHMRFQNWTFLEKQNKWGKSIVGWIYIYIYKSIEIILYLYQI